MRIRQILRRLAAPFTGQPIHGAEALRRPHFELDHGEANHEQDREDGPAITHVRRDYGAEVANRVAQRLVVAPHRQGGQAQYIPQPVRKADGDALTSVFAWAQGHLQLDLTIPRLASRAAMSRRTFIRRFEEATGMPPGEWVAQARMSRARELLETTQIPIEDVATATGFGSADAMRHHFRTRLSTTPTNYRAAFLTRAL
jgi:AraC family transcriptional activator FtrA